MNQVTLQPATVQAIQDFHAIWRQDPAAQYDLSLTLTISSQNISLWNLNCLPLTDITSQIYPPKPIDMEAFSDNILTEEPEVDQIPSSTSVEEDTETEVYQKVRDELTQTLTPQSQSHPNPFIGGTWKDQLTKILKRLVDKGHNIVKLKRKLEKDLSPLYLHLLSSVKNSSIQGLTWKNPLANQIIKDDASFIKSLRNNSNTKGLYETFMKPIRQMKPTLPLSVENVCREFVSNFSDSNYSGFSEKLIHDGTWKESENKILSVVNEIFKTMEDIWNNSALNFEVAGVLNEGTYQSTVIVPFIRAVLKNLPFRFLFISTSERESIASADRKGDSKVGRRPDIMFMVKHLDVLFEIMYVECSRLVCTSQKKVDDDIKLWRECNDGMYYTRKTLHPDKDQFGIVGIQIAEDILHLNVLIRDKTNVNRYYNIESAKIPVQKSDETIVIKFVETLLLLRNIIITNLSLLYNGPVCIAERQKEDSTTVNSE
ncbi:42724_t:CDS:2 [Gigaspora margarita]|uniref:42724_t:CDS:1 n=1 Tax=Gigaspora margarita TaxID=4874 RepID=A0ABN7UMM4_GIGMA|nr:42724_t:CDS:2 [Gigaspora margarita]